MAAKLTQTIVESGIEGIHLTFVDFIEDLKIFGNEVLPRLKAMLAEHDIVVGG